MKTLAWGVVGGLWALTLASSSAAQSLEQRIARAPDGTVRFSYAARPGVYGDGHNIRINDDDGDWSSACDSGPVRITLTVRGGAVTDLRTRVGGEWRAGSAGTDLGTVSAREAATYLLALARRDAGRASDRAVFAASIADSTTIWPELLQIARDERLSRKVRRTAVFWVGQAAGEAATRGLTELVDDNAAERDVRTQAVFALSQRPRDEGVPALIRIARENKDPEIRRKAIFWLGQSNDPRALSLFEELLAKP